MYDEVLQEIVRYQLKEAHKEKSVMMKNPSSRVRYSLRREVRLLKQAVSR
jgi:hypothetical protein